MTQSFSFQQFLNRYPSDDVCLDEIRKLRYPKGIYCATCRKIVTHYRLTGRTAYSCKLCRKQVYPLSGTVFEKTTTPLRYWFYSMYLMTQTRGRMTAKDLQRELGVTYKTAWRLRRQILPLMQQNDGDLLLDEEERDIKKRVHRWSFFNTIEITVVQKEEKT